MFEAKSVRTGEKRKREVKGDPGDVDGYQGPWREYVGQVKVAKPTDEEKAAIELLFAEKKKKKEGKLKKEEEPTMEESSKLHGVCVFAYSLFVCLLPLLEKVQSTVWRILLEVFVCRCLFVALLHMQLMIRMTTWAGLICMCRKMWR